MTKNMLSHNQIFYGIFFVIITLLFVFLSKISNILLPFTSGLLLAYFLGPIVQKLQKYLGSRTLACSIVLVLFLTIISITYHYLGPLFKKELIALIENFPDIVHSLSHLIEPRYKELTDKYEMLPKISNLSGKVSPHTITISATLLQNIFQSSMAIVNLISLIFITPIVTFYFMKDWDNGIRHLENLIPRKQIQTIKRVFREIDHIVSAYIRGQTTVCLILGVFYAIALKALGLTYAFTIGITAGILTFIPFFGAILGMAIGVIVSIIQFHSVSTSTIVLAIFLLGQFLEGNFVTPKIIGKRIGLHPVLIMFSILTGGSLFGFVGILFAIPTAAILKVIIDNLLNSYRKSHFFKQTNHKKHYHKPRTQRNNA